MKLKIAQQHAKLLNGTIRPTGKDKELVVSLNDWTRAEYNRMAYYTEDAAHAVDMLGAMRRNYDVQKGRKS